MGPMITYLAGVALSLYVVYLYAYCLYDVPGYYEASRGREPKRIVLSRIVYLVAIAAAFVPALNWMFPIVAAIAALVGRALGDFQIKSWLFEKPTAGEKAVDEKNDNK